MTELEILAELKRCYEYLEDIYDNAEYEQFSEETNHRNEICAIQNQLAELYSSAYNATGKEIYYDKDIRIDKTINGYYLDTTTNDYVGIDYADNEDKWWEDNDFITFGERFEKYNPNYEEE